MQADMTGPTLRMVRVFSAPPAIVYASFVDPERLARWFAPHGHSVLDVATDVRVGGTYRVVVARPTGPAHTMTGEYREIVPDQRLVMTWTSDTLAPWFVAPGGGNRALITIELQPLGDDRTELTLVHESTPAEMPAELDELEEGWTECLDSLAAVVADDLALAFRQAMVETLGKPQKEPNAVVKLLREHLHCDDPAALPAVTDSYSNHLHLPFQIALDAFLAEPGRTSRVLGVNCPSKFGSLADLGSISLALLLIEPSFTWAPVGFAPASYKVVQSSSDTTKACLEQGLILFEDASGPGVIWVRGRLNNHVMIDILHESSTHAISILRDLRQLGIELSPYRGQFIAIGSDIMWAPTISFLPRPEVAGADEVILPPGLLEEIEEHSVDVMNARHALRASGRHLKRGLLLHGPPGTGKTHTIRYLVSQMPDLTVAVLSGTRMQSVPKILDVVDVIAPAVVILDDVDFIAEDRSLPGMTNTREDLFNLLEVLDGLTDDVDLTFILTTNRPNRIEPAVAARPGRIDQAVEVPLPDAECRRRLLHLYSKMLDVRASEAQVGEFVDRTEGVTASFVREAVRRAAAASVWRDNEAAAAAEGDGRPSGASVVDPTSPIMVTGDDLLAALDEMLDPANPMVNVLLGAKPSERTSLRRVEIEES